MAGLPWGRQRAHFLHVGKTAGTAVKEALRPHQRSGTYRLVLHRHGTTLRDVPVGERFFFVVRDPVDRFVSGFYSRQRQGRPRHDTPWSPAEAVVFERFPTANALAEALAAADPEARAAAEQAMGAIEHVRDSYWRWFHDEATLRARAEDLLFVAFQDRLAADFPLLLDRLGLTGRAALPADDVRAHRNPATVDRALSPVAAAALREWYARDDDFLAVCRELRAALG